MDNTLKTVAESEFELVVENKIVMFGGRDLTGYAHKANDDGTLGEYFTKSTDLESEYTATGRLYVDFEHGKDPDEIGNDKNNILGYVNWKSARVVDDGVIVKRVLNRRHRYMKWLEPLIRAGLVGNSSEAVPGKTEKSADGMITKWALKRDTLTVNPMEPRMITENALGTAIKALVEEFPEYESLLPSEPAALPVSDDKIISTQNTEKNIMEQKEIDAAVQTAVAAELAKQAELQKAETEKLAALKAAEEEGYKKAVEELKGTKAPAFNTITERGFSEEKDAVPAFKHWLATGDTNGGLIAPDSVMENMQSGKAAWNVTTGASGGYLVPDPLYNQIIAKRDLQSAFRQLPTQKFVTQADHLLVPVEDTSHTSFVATAEAASYDEDEGTVGQVDLVLYKYTKMQKVSEEFMMYNTTNFESWLVGALARASAATENTIWHSGVGTTAPLGIEAAAGSTVANTSATTDVILPAELSAFVGYLGAGYNVPSECGFMMANVSKWYLRGIAATAGAFVYQSTPDGMISNDQLLGYKIVINDDVQAYTAASQKTIFFGNWNYYGIVEKPGMVVQRNPYLYMANGQIGLFASIFRGGATLQKEAIYHFLNAA